jgi:hypothetical protein
MRLRALASAGARCFDGAGESVCGARESVRAGILGWSISLAAGRISRKLREGLDRWRGPRMCMLLATEDAGVTQW